MNIPKPLEAIVRNGIHSIDGERNLWPAMPSLSEQLMAENFAETINSGALSVEDAYRNFWSYEEYAELWNLPQDREWRALLPNWRKIVLQTSSRLNEEMSERLAHILMSNQQALDQHLHIDEYSPFIDDYMLGVKIIGENPLLREAYGTNKLAEELYQRLRLGMCDKKGIHKRNLQIVEALTLLGKTDKLIEIVGDELVKVPGVSKYDKLLELLINSRNPFAVHQILRLYGEFVKIKNRGGGYYSFHPLYDALKKIDSEEAIDALQYIFNDIGEGADELASKRSKRGFETLFNAAKDQKHPYRAAAIIALAENGYDEVLPYALAYLEKNHNDKTSTSSGISYSLGKLGNLGAVETLKRLLRDKSTSYRNAYARALYELIGDAAEDSIIEFVDSGDDDQKFAASELAKIRSGRTIQKLIEMASHGREEHQENALMYFKDVESPETIEALVNIIRDDKNKYHSRSYALRELSKCEFPGFRDLVVDIALHDRNKSIREYAVRYLNPEDEVERAILEESLKVGPSWESVVPFLRDKGHRLEVLSEYLVNPESVYKARLIHLMRELIHGREEREASRFDELVPPIVHHLQELLTKDLHQEALRIGNLVMEPFIQRLSIYVRNKNYMHSYGYADQMGNLSEKLCLETKLNYVYIDICLHCNEDDISNRPAIYERIIGSLEDNLKQEQIDHIRECIDLLGKIGSKSATPYLIDLISNDNETIRLHSVEALGKIKAEELLDAFPDDSYELQDPKKKEVYVSALTKIGTRDAIKKMRAIKADYTSVQEVHSRLQPQGYKALERLAA